MPRRRRLLKRRCLHLCKDIVAIGFVSALMLWTTAAPAAEHSIPLFMSASNDLQQGFVRIINHSNESGVVVVRALDDTGREFGPIELTMAPFQKLQFNSNDLELGNASKGIPLGIGGAQGDWRLRFESNLALEVLAYVRTADGFLTSMHDLVSDEGSRYRVPIFNPGSNRDQQSLLRLINPHDVDVAVSIAGVDDGGKPASGNVTLTLPAGETQTVSAQDLESGGRGITGSLGDGSGKWELFVSADHPVQLVNLLESTTGHLTNLSSSPVEGGFFREIDGALTPPTDPGSGDGPAFVAVGDEAIAISPDGVTWKSYPIRTTRSDRLKMWRTEKDFGSRSETVECLPARMGEIGCMSSKRTHLTISPAE